MYWSSTSVELFLNIILTIFHNVSYSAKILAVADFGLQSVDQISTCDGLN